MQSPASLLPPRWSARVRAWWRGRHHLPVPEALRGGVVCAIPAVLAALLHDPLLCWSAIAAFWTCLSDPAGASRRRRAMAGVTLGVFGALGSWCAVASSAVPVLTVILTGAVVFVGGLMRSRGAETGLRALLAATAFSVAAAFPVHGFRVATHYASYFLVGNVWAVACGACLWQTSRMGSVRRAAFVYFSGMAGFVHRLGLDIADVHAAQSLRAIPACGGRAQLRAKLEALHTCIALAGESCSSVACDWAAIGDKGMAVLAGLESLFQWNIATQRHEAIRLLSPVLAQLANLIEAWSLAVKADANAAGAAIESQRCHLDREIRLCRRLLKKLDADAASREFLMTGLALVVQLKELVVGPRAPSTSRRASGQAVSMAREDRGPRQFLRELWNEANAGSPFFPYAARLALGAMIAVAISTHLPLKQGYWLVLTSLFVVQPNFAQTLKVSTLRVGGTVLGATLASALGVVFHSPLLLALTILPLAAGSLAARAVSYVSYILFLTPHFILVAQLGLPTGSPWELAAWRIVNSTAGAMLGIVITFILWPGWEKYRLASSVSRAIDGTAAYLSAALNPLSDNGQYAEPQLADLRREACLAVDDVEATIGRMRLEPFAQPRRIACGTIVLKSLREIIGAASLLESMKSPMCDSGDIIRLNSFGEWACASLKDDARRLKNKDWLTRFERQERNCDDATHTSFMARFIEQRVTSAIATLHTVTRGVV